MKNNYNLRLRLRALLQAPEKSKPGPNQFKPSLSLKPLQLDGTQRSLKRYRGDLVFHNHLVVDQEKPRPAQLAKGRVRFNLSLVEVPVKLNLLTKMPATHNHCAEAPVKQPSVVVQVKPRLYAEAPVSHQPHQQLWAKS